MSAGVPVVATSVGGPREFVEDGRSGYLVRPRDVAGMARVCVRLLKRPALARSIGRRAREVAMRRFHVDRVVRGYEALYEDVMDGSR